MQRFSKKSLPERTPRSSDRTGLQIFAAPWIVSFLSTLGALAFYLVFLRPGYAVNDDPAIISIASGYVGRGPQPFLIYSNVLLGFLLAPLYALHTVLNWEILLFVGINFVCLGVLFHLILSHGLELRSQIFSITIVLIADAYGALNITYTTVAALSCLTGIGAIVTASRVSTPFRKWVAASGGILLVVGSLIRVEMLLLVLAATIPALILIHRSFVLQSLLRALLITGLFVTAGYFFERIYVSLSPEWSSYTIYNKVRQSIHDTNRLQNFRALKQIQQIGWSYNDRNLFAHWFFPDPATYSLGHLQMLVDQVSPLSMDPITTARNFFIYLASSNPLPYLLLIPGVWLFMFANSMSRRAVLPLMAVVALFLVENLDVAWVWKDPEYVVLSTLTNSAIFSMLILNWQERPDPARITAAIQNSHLRRFSFLGAVVCLIVAAGLAANQSIATTMSNMRSQIAYQLVLSDLNALQSDGRISENALIVSPEYGIPLEWSDPLRLDFPRVRYLDTGWLTFSPPYEEVLQAYGIGSLADAFYEDKDLYLMTRSSFTPLLARYYAEHENIHVNFQSIYTMRNVYHFAGYDDIQLYKVVRAP